MRYVAMRNGAVRRIVTWCNGARCGAVRCGAVRCDAVLRSNLPATQRVVLYSICGAGVEWLFIVIVGQRRATGYGTYQTESEVA